MTSILFDSLFIGNINLKNRFSNFLSPDANRRTDRYGGSTVNRARFVTEIVKRLRKRVGYDYPIMIKMNGHDFLNDGLQPTEAVELAKIFETSGISAIEVSGGTSAERWCHVVRKSLKSMGEESYFRSFSRIIKQHVSIPVILVRGNRTFSLMESLIADGTCDLVSLSRPLIREPDLISKFKFNMKEKSDCFSCNTCFKTIFSHPVACPYNGASQLE